MDIVMPSRSDKVPDNTATYHTVTNLWKALKSCHTVSLIDRTGICMKPSHKMQMRWWLQADGFRLRLSEKIRKFFSRILNFPKIHNPTDTAVYAHRYSSHNTRCLMWGLQQQQVIQSSHINTLWPDLQNILRQSYDYLTTEPKLYNRLTTDV